MPRLDLTEYGISMKTGFIFEHPLARLPPYFDPWNNVALRCAELLANKTIREEIEKLPLLDFTKLNDVREVKLGHLELVAMAAGYLWQNGTDPSDVPQVLPKCLAVPLYGMYETYDLAPVLTYADFFLNNAVLKDPNGPIQLENIAAIIDIPGNKEDWDWYFTVSCMAEYEFAKAVPAIQDILDAVVEAEEEKMTVSLNKVSEAVQNMQKTCTLFHEKLTAESFRKVVSFFQGYDGLIFEGIKEEPVKMKRSNAGQTSTLKVLDALLGIEHPKDRSDYVEEFMKYIPPNHRNFIKALRETPQQLKPIVEASSNSDLKKAFNSLIKSITKFRSYHVRLATRFIFKAVKTLPDETDESLIRFKKSFRMEFIKGMRDDSKQATTS